MRASPLQHQYQKSVIQRGRNISKKEASDLFQLSDEGATAPSCTPKSATACTCYSATVTEPKPQVMNNLMKRNHRKLVKRRNFFSFVFFYLQQILILYGFTMLE